MPEDHGNSTNDGSSRSPFQNRANRSQCARIQSHEIRYSLNEATDPFYSGGISRSALDSHVNRYKSVVFTSHASKSRGKLGKTTHKRISGHEVQRTYPFGIRAYAVQRLSAKIARYCERRPSFVLAGTLQSWSSMMPFRATSEYRLHTGSVTVSERFQWGLNRHFSLSRVYLFLSSSRAWNSSTGGKRSVYMFHTCSGLTNACSLYILVLTEYCCREQMMQKHFKTKRTEKEINSTRATETIVRTRGAQGFSTIASHDLDGNCCVMTRPMNHSMTYKRTADAHVKAVPRAGADAKKRLKLLRNTTRSPFRRVNAALFDDMCPFYFPPTIAQDMREARRLRGRACLLRVLFFY